MSQEIVRIQNLSTEFKSREGVVRAVDDISFEVNQGEVIGIVGESGSGKSVTSLSIMQLIQSPNGRIASGQILYKGADLLALHEEDKRRYRGKDIAMIFQEPMTSLNPVHTCGRQVAEAMITHLGLDRKNARMKTIELFEKVQLPRPAAIYDSYPHQLSGGQKQRVMIAMAISCKPSVLIADEPTTALDVTVQAAILKLLKSLQEETGMSIIFITHDLGVVAGLADRVIVMYKGKVVEQGKVRDVFTSPRHPYTKGLLACRPSMNVSLRKLPVISDFMEVDQEGNITEKQHASMHSEGQISEDSKQAERNTIYSKMPLLVIDNLSMHYPVKSGFFSKAKGLIKAVDDVSFKLYPGETLGLVGESGCGKTTLGRSVIRLINPTEGRILYKGIDITGMTDTEIRPLRKTMQIIFQDPYSSLNPRITVGSAILEPMKVHGLYSNDRQRKEKVMDLLRKVNLKEEHFHRYPHEFSGGQRQRIGIARALAINPEFIICDESVSALDVSVQAQVLNLLNDLKREFGLTYIFISHDLSVVKFMSDRIMVMKEGRIVEEGDPESIYHAPKSDYTKKLIDAIPEITF